MDASGEAEEVLQNILGKEEIPSPASIITNMLTEKSIDELLQSVVYQCLTYPEERALSNRSGRFILIDPALAASLDPNAANSSAGAAATAAGTGDGTLTVGGDGADDRKGLRTPAKTPSRDAGRRGKTGGAKSKAPKTPLKKSRRETEHEGGALDDALDKLVEADDTLKQARWIVPAKGAVTIRVRFRSHQRGRFEEQLTLETVGSARQYVVTMRGQAVHPGPVTDPRTVFAKVVKNMPPSGIVHGTFVSSTNTLDFGPLLSGKTRDDYKGERFPANVAHLTLTNTQGLPAQISASLEQDQAFATFTLDPPQLELAPGETQTLRVWAYPKNAVVYKDRLVLCSRNNPEPMVYNLLVEGVEPALELEKKTVAFDRVLLHRKDVKTLNLRNRRRVPIAWQLVGADQLGDEFTVEQLGGIIEPNSSLEVRLHFSASRPVTIKKTVRLEISDAENIIGVVQVENIFVTAEAYDVALDLSFPKHSEGGLDFEVAKVGVEKLLSCTLKNKGRYDIGFRFSFDRNVARRAGLKGLTAESFTITPPSGTLSASDKPLQVRFALKCPRELSARDLPLLKCEVVEPSISETIAHIPISVSFKSAYAKYMISPPRTVNFGAVVLGGGKQTRELLIENKGITDLRFQILNTSGSSSGSGGGTTTAGGSSGAGAAAGSSSSSSSKSRAGGAGSSSNAGLAGSGSNSSSGVAGSSSQSGGGAGSGGGGRSGTPQRGPRHNAATPGPAAGGSGGGSGSSGNTAFNTGKFSTGCFTISSAGGTVQPGGSQKIIIEADPQRAGREEKLLRIEIENRAPDDHPGGIPCSLMVEACNPSIARDDMSLVFPNYPVLQLPPAEVSGPVFVESDNEFNFGPVVVGRRAVARFKIVNPSKVHCDMTVVCRAKNEVLAPTKTKGAPAVVLPEGFTIEPAQFTIPRNDSVLVNVTFAPTSIQSYSAEFEAVVDNAVDSASSSLHFGIVGSGTLPRVSVVQPQAKTAEGLNILQIRRTLVNQSRTGEIIVRNEGATPAKVTLEIVRHDNRRLQSARQNRPPSARGGGSGAGGSGGGAGLGSGGGGSLGASGRPPSKGGARPSVSSAKGLKRKPSRPNTPRRKGAPGSAAGAASAEAGDEYPTEPVAPGMATDGTFTVVDRGLPVEVPSHATRALAVRFSPTEIQSYHAQLRLTVADNDFEAIFIDVAADGYEEDLSIEGLEGEDHLRLGDTFVDESVSKTVSLFNHTNQPLRFAWSRPSEDIVFAPSIGHIQVGASKDVTVTFCAKAPVAHEALAVGLDVCRIQYTRPDTAEDWDDSCETVKYVVSEGPDGGLVREKLVEKDLEPEHSMLAETARQLTLKVTAIADYARFECAVTEIPFAETLMFQTREFALPLKNTGQSRLPFRWELLDDRMAESQPKAKFPFSVEPQEGEIAAGATQTVTVRFSPLDAGEFAGQLTCAIPHAAAGMQLPSIELSGSSARPLCHLDLPDSDYLKNGRRAPHLPGPDGNMGLDTNVHVLELTARGVNTTRAKEFAVLNPSDEDYAFTVDFVGPPAVASRQLAGQVIEAGAIRCLHTSGMVRRGKRFTLRFEYAPTELSLVETFWRFQVPSHDLSLLILVVGHAEEPKVRFDSTSLQLAPTIVGKKVTAVVNLVNDEDTRYSFQFDPARLATLRSAGEVDVEPLRGKVQPHSVLPVRMSFTPSIEQTYSFSVLCDIARTPTPASVHVQYEAYVVRAEFSEVAGAQRVCRTDDQLDVDFGTAVHVHEKEVRSFYLTNNGNFPFEFSVDWRNKSQGRGACISAEPQRGLVAPSLRQRIDIAFQTSQAGLTLDSFPLVCKVQNGPKYTLILNGGASLPQLEFSAKDIDFGKAYLFQPGMPIAERTLTLTNREATPMHVTLLRGGAVNATLRRTTLAMSNTGGGGAGGMGGDEDGGDGAASNGSSGPVSPAATLRSTLAGAASTLAKASPSSSSPSSKSGDWLQVQMNFSVLEPGKSGKVKFSFLPHQAKAYRETLAFEVNSLSRLKLTVKGTGTNVKLGLEKAAHKSVNFGACAVDERRMQTVTLLNQGILPLTVMLTGDMTGLAEKFVRIEPSKPTEIAPNSPLQITAIFHPRQRVAAFREEICVESMGQTRPLFTVSGSCQGLDISLDSDHLHFGPTVARSSCVKTLMMRNLGDVGARFEWSVPGPAQSWFSLSPLSGYMSPGQEVPLAIEFHPPQVRSRVLFKDLLCQVEGADPLRLELGGTSVAIQPEREVLHFSTVVRVPDAKSIKVTNPTDKLWAVAPVFDHDYFSGPENFVVQPGQTRLYEITYLPLTMTHGGAGADDGKSHSATLFLPVPDGTGVLVNLSGTSLPGKPVGTITREVPCKMWYTESISVKNWLAKPQRFRVHINRSKADPSTQLTGLDYLDVPASGSGVYKLQFFAHREGVATAEVVFRNELTQEFVSYDVTLKSTPAGVLDTIVLTTPVRQVLVHNIRLANPLSTSVAFTQTCTYIEGGKGTCHEIHCPPSFKVPAKTDSCEYSFDFLPLRARETTARLTLTSQELGSFQYDLVLDAQPAGPLATERFTAALGETLTKRFRFMNFNTSRGELNVTVDNSEFIAPPTISTPPALKTGSEVTFDITYEPSKLGDCRGTMTLSSTAGGEYVVPLFGQCLPPKPAGPFTIKTGTRVSVPFKNIFTSTETFVYSVDNPCFSVKDKDVIRGKDSKDIMVKFEANQEVMKRGKLVVEPLNGKDGIQWIFYLKGVPGP